MNNWVDELNNTLDLISGEMELNEETIKDYMVKPFLENIGYDKEFCWYKYENSLKDGIVDIYIELKDKKEEGIYVEVKRGDEEITLDNIKQIVNYLCSPDYKYPKVKWGILTNGKKYYLINKDIVSEKNNKNGQALLDKIVLSCDLKKWQKNIKYFSKEYLFYNKKTYLMRDIAQFKAYKEYKCWDVYFSTLYGFFDYYCEIANPDLRISEHYIPLYLADIREKDFKDYLLTLKPKDKNKNKLSVNIIKSKCSHISAFYREFERRKNITVHNFKNVRDNILKEFISDDIVVNNKDFDNYLTTENVDKIIKNFSKSSKNEAIIRVIIFTLIVYYGFTKAQVVGFLSQSWSDAIDFTDKKIIYQGVKRNMPSFLEKNFRKLKKVTGKKKSILGSEGERGKSISIDIVSTTFDDIKKMENVDGRKYFTPENTRKMLIKKIFEAGYSIEEICGYVGISVGACGKVIGKEKIAEMGLKRWNNKNKRKSNHPFEKQFS